jgi:hypothetical protein
MKIKQNGNHHAHQSNSRDDLKSRPSIAIHGMSGAKQRRSAFTVDHQITPKRALLGRNYPKAAAISTNSNQAGSTCAHLC